MCCSSLVSFMLNFIFYKLTVTYSVFLLLKNKFCSKYYFFPGVRGAMAFALAIRNTLTEQRHLMLTTTSLIAIVTVIVCGGFATQLLAWLGIPYVF